MAEPMTQPEWSPSRAVELVERALGRMSARQRAAFVLFELEGVPVAGVARVLGMPEASARRNIHEARTAERKAVAGLLLSAGLTSFVTGVTEPLEFAFLFVAPLLFAVHAVLTGLSLAIAAALGIRDGFGFSAGLIDYLLNFNIATRPLLIIPVGLAYAVLYYFLFRVLIRRFDLATPGRERTEEEAEEAGLIARST